MSILERVKQFVHECNLTNSSLDKMEVIKKYQDLQEIFKYVYDEINFQYGITSANIRKQSQLTTDDVLSYANIFNLLNDLNDRKITGHLAIKTVLKFIKDNPGYEEVILNIIDRNLKTRADYKLINKIYPNCIPVFEVELANNYDEKTRKKIDWSKQVWLASRKLDGVRCCVKFFTNLSVLAIGRSGKEFFTLNKIKAALCSINLPNNIVFDGEISLRTIDGKDDFQGILSEIRKKEHTIENVRFNIFNLIPLREFENAEGPSLYLDRFATLNSLIHKDDPDLSILEQTRVMSDEHLEELKAIAAQNNWEGLILRRGDVPYEGKRSDNLLKVKSFKDAEYKVLSAEMGLIRYICPTTGLEKEETMLSAVTIEHKGNPVRVGSGFKLEERQTFFKDPSLIIGKMITVKYFEESIDSKTEKLSLRFPTCKAIYCNKKDI
jgi:DNA ligase-1